MGLLLIAIFYYYYYYYYFRKGPSADIYSDGSNSYRQSRPKRTRKEITYSDYKIVDQLKQKKKKTLLNAWNELRGWASDENSTLTIRRIYCSIQQKTKPFWHRPDRVVFYFFLRGIIRHPLTLLDLEEYTGGVPGSEGENVQP